MCFDLKKVSKDIEILINKFVTECNTRRVKSIDNAGCFNDDLHRRYLKLKITFANDETIDFLCPGIVHLRLLEYFCFPESNESVKKCWSKIAQKIDLLRTN